MKTCGKKRAFLSGIACAVIIVVGVWRSWGHMVFLVKFERLGKNVQGYPEYRHRQTGIIFVRLPGGSFNMGSPASEALRQDSEGPVHAVTLSPFLVAKCEVTQAQWGKVMGSNMSFFKGQDLPVETVSWEDCREFSEKTGLELPTEAQWEYACRAGTTGPSGTGNLDEMGWHHGNSGGTTHPAGEKDPNDFGLCDMQGNVSEWCQDVFDEEFYSKPAATRKDPACAAGSESRVFRGGSFIHRASICRSAARYGCLPASRHDFIGFRPSSSLP